MPNLEGQYVVGNSSSSTHGQKQVQAIMTLRLGKQVDNQVAMLEETPKLSEEEESQDKSIRNFEPNTTIPIIMDEIPRKFVHKAPFPERLMVPKKGSKFEDILEVFKQVLINIPFLDAI